MKRLLLCLLPFVATPTSAATLHISAAASLNDVLQEIATPYKNETGDTLVFNFGSSNLLARQILEGAPADVFISADEARMDLLQKSHLLVNRSRRSILSNSLVIIVPVDSNVPIQAPSDLAGPAVRRIALAQPESVPAGIYAKEYLRRLNLWQRVAGKVVPTENVRAALAAVESGDVEGAIVYKTDALVSRSVRIAYAFPRAGGPRIAYPAAVMAESRQKRAAERFVEFLQSPVARDIFIHAGFLRP